MIYELPLRESSDEPYARRGGYSGSGRGPEVRSTFNRNRSRQDSDHLPEWASEDVTEASKSGGGFDSR